ncbi:MAG: CapA family protein [Acidimicrobiia bacterium]|nr:CapA family protein [Acidimicrobiia bacterium]
MSSDWTIAAAGDALITHRITQHDRAEDPRFGALGKLIESADVSTVNLETSVFDLRSFAGWPAAERGGSYLVAPPIVLDELLDLGFRLFARANNHAGDWGIEGMLATTAELDRRGMAHAGVGMHLADASAPVYIDTVGGRVAMISLTTTFPVSSKAGDQRPDIVGRPGCNGISLTRRLQLSTGLYDEMTRVVDAHGDPSLFDRSNLGISQGTESAIVEHPSPSDVDRVLAEIDKANALADLVLVHGHTHEPANHVVAPPGWLGDLARRCIDAGAHAYIGHGPHQLRGIEMYRSRPIFYSLGNFIVHRDTQEPLPADQYAVFGLDQQASHPHEYYAARDQSKHRMSMTTPEYHESVVPVMRFSDGELVEMDLHPIELCVDGSPGSRGTPRMAEPAHATRILGRMAGLAQEFGFTFDIRDGKGRWRTGAGKAGT